MKKGTVLTIALINPLVVCAESVYLDCSVSSKDEVKKFAVEFDEGTQKVNHIRARGEDFHAEGVFSASTISYEQNLDKLENVKIAIRYEIDRTDLSAREVIVVEPSNPEYLSLIPASKMTNEGTCSKRKT